MTARQRRYWWVAAILLGVGAGIGVGYLVVTGTDAGRTWLVSALLPRANGVFKGRGALRVGRLVAVGPEQIVAENVSLVDTAGVPVVTVSRLEGTLDGRALFRKAIHIRRLAVEGVTVVLRQDTVGRPWNIAHLIAGDTMPGTPHPPGFGDDVRIDSLLLRGGDVQIRAPWEPHPIFTGAARDSVIAVRDSLHDLEHTATGLLFERRRIQLTMARVHALVVVDPQRRSSSLQLDSLVGRLSDPPVTIRHAQGEVAWTGDSLRLALSRVDLPASFGSATGTVSWASPGPVRYDVRMQANAGLSDLGWIWDVLPAVGRGTATVRLRTLADADEVEYTLDRLDVASGPSRLRGGLVVTSRPADLLLHRVDLTFAPLASDLLRRLSYEALPPSVRGIFTGRLVANAGGPLTAFAIDRLEAQFVDANVPTRSGVAPAVSRLRLRGLVSLGERPRASNLVIADARLDLRSVRALAPKAPVVSGVLTGGLTVRSADLASMDLAAIGLTWTDAGGAASTVRGAVRSRFGRSQVAVTADLQLDPLSMRALARIDSTLPLRADLAGRISLNGTLDSLQWSGRLFPVVAGDSAMAGGVVALNGSAGVTDREWYGSATGTLDVVDLARWLGRRDVPATSLSGDVRLAAQGTRDGVRAGGDSTAFHLVRGRADAVLRQAGADDRPAFELAAAATLDPARLAIDSAIATLGGVVLSVNGGLARDSLGSDTLVVSARADRIEAARPELRRLAGMLQPVDSSLAASLGQLVADTLRGDASLSGFVTGHLGRLDATIALGARDVQVGGIHVGRAFGSARATDLTGTAAFDGAASLDEVRGVGAVQIRTAAFRLVDATPDSGRLVLDVGSDEDAHLVVRGGYTARGERTVVQLDSIGLRYDQSTWRAQQPLRLVTDAGSLRLDPVTLRSNQGGEFTLQGDLPKAGPVTGRMRLVRFPVGEVAALLAGTPPFEGTLTGDASLAGVREAPLISWNITGDSLGVIGYRLPPVGSTGRYADRRVIADAVMRDSLGGSVRVQGQLPVDLRLTSVDNRRLSDVVSGEVLADSLRLQALPLAIEGVRRLQGVLTGRLALSGTADRPVADGTLQLDEVSASIDALGITPTEGRVVLRARADSLVLESLRVRSGGQSDTVGATGVLRFAANTPLRVEATIAANNFTAARQRDGTELYLGGRLRVRGDLARPVVSGAVVIPRANLVVNPLAARTALDLNSEAARALLGADEVPVAETAAQSLSRLGALVTVENARVDLGQEVWVQTPEARVRLTGGLGIAMSGDLLALDGQIATNRGQYRLDLGVVKRTFSIDSGRVRFFGRAAIPPTLDITATHVVRMTGGTEVPVRVNIGGTYDVPVLRLSSTDPLYTSAPESEIISLLVFGAPTFALDGQRQSTVQAVSGVLLPTVGGFAEGKLQRWLPSLSTLQIQTGSGQDQAQLTPSRLLDNLSISAGKQIGDRTFLRVNTGVCRGAGDATSGNRLWAGLAAEYRIGPTVFGQVGVDPGSAPCTRLGGDQLPRRQFGFDLFKEWIW